MGKIGCCYYDPAQRKLYLIEDSVDSSKFDLALNSRSSFSSSLSPFASFPSSFSSHYSSLPYFSWLYAFFPFSSATYALPFPLLFLSLLSLPGIVVSPSLRLRPCFLFALLLPLSLACSPLSPYLPLLLSSSHAVIFSPPHSFHALVITSLLDYLLLPWVLPPRISSSFP